MPFNIIGSVISLAGKAFDFFGKKADIDLEKYKIDGKIDEVRLQAALQLQLKEQDHLGGRFMRYGFVYPLAAYWTAIIVDSIGQQMFHWNYDVLALPAPMDQWAGWIIMYLFLVTTLRNK